MVKRSFFVVDRIFTVGPGKTRVVFSDKKFCLKNKNKTLYVFDSNTYEIFQSVKPSASVILPPGERNKNWSGIDSIVKSALDSGCARDSYFMGVGGGVVCDLTGFAASLYMRGTGLILVPTTLLAMTDAALGGKTGFDYQGYKNMLGSFYPAEEVRICSEVLKSLSDKEFKSGMAEVIKHALLTDSGLLEFMIKKNKSILERDPQIMAELIERSLSIKGYYVEQDFMEHGIRAHLNFGHTFGHALESVTGFKNVTHGQAVIWGIYMALSAGVLIGETDPRWLKEVKTVIDMYGYKTDLHRGLDTDSLIAAMLRDKKKKNGEVIFILQQSKGKTFASPLSKEILKKVLT